MNRVFKEKLVDLVYQVSLDSKEILALKVVLVLKVYLVFLDNLVINTYTT